MYQSRYFLIAALGAAFAVIMAWGAFQMFLPRVQFIVPEGYMGRLEIIETAQAPNLLCGSLWGSSLTFPMSGRVEVKSLRLLQDGVRLSCIDQKGKNIPTTSMVGDNEIALRLGISTNSRRFLSLTYIVGTKAPTASSACRAAARSTARR